MSLYAIGDLHLCLGAPKPMDVFGGAWVGYMEKLKEGLSVIGPEDTTVLLGDLSWALDLNQAAADFAWVDQIPGQKIILKGNHDYWWSTAAKFYKFCDAQGFSNQRILNNNHYEYGDWVKLEIPLVYKEGVTAKPNMLVISCAASQYGDYFTGYDKSALWVDAVEFIY